MSPARGSRGRSRGGRHGMASDLARLAMYSLRATNERGLAAALVTLLPSSKNWTMAHLDSGTVRI